MSTDELCSVWKPADTFHFLGLIGRLDAERCLDTASLMIPQNNQAFLVANQNLQNKNTINLEVVLQKETIFN